MGGGGVASIRSLAAVTIFESTQYSTCNKHNIFSIGYQRGTVPPSPLILGPSAFIVIHPSIMRVRVPFPLPIHSSYKFLKLLSCTPWKAIHPSILRVRCIPPTGKLWVVGSITIFIVCFLPKKLVMRTRIVKIEINFLGKNLSIEPATFWATVKHATYCATEARCFTYLNSLSFFLNFDNSISHHC